MFEIRTARLALRLHGPHTVDAMHAIVADWDVARMTGSFPWPADRAFTARRCEPFDLTQGVVGAVWLGETVIGGMGCNAKGFGYMFHRDHWGQGYATEMGRALIGHCFASYDWPEIAAAVWFDNPASARVLQKLGFEPRPDSHDPCAARGRKTLSRNFCLTRARHDALCNDALSNGAG